MKFQDHISNMNTYIHTDKQKPICPHFFKVGGIKSVWVHHFRGCTQVTGAFAVKFVKVALQTLEHHYFE